MVRLTETQYSALERIAAETEQDPAKLIRYAIDALFKHFERSGNRLVLPLDFGETVQVLKAAAQETKKQSESTAAQAA